MFFSLVFLPAKLAKTPEKKKFSTLPKAKNTFCVRHGSHERYSLGVASGAASPRRSLHRNVVYAIFEPCLSPKQKGRRCMPAPTAHILHDINY